MELFIIFFLITSLVVVFLVLKLQTSILLKGLDQFIDGQFFNVLPVQNGIFKKISEKINLIVHQLFLEKEKVEELLQEQQLLRYEFTEFFLHANSLYDKHKVYTLVLDSLYKMFHPEAICLLSFKKDLKADVFIRQNKDRNIPLIITKEDINIANKKDLLKTLNSNTPSDKDTSIFVSEIVDKVQSFLQVPIFLEKESIGVIQVFNKLEGFDNNDKELVQTIAAFLANQLKVIQTIIDEKGALEKYGSIINILNDGIIIFDENKEIIMENPAARDFFSLSQVKKNILINDIISNQKFSNINLVLFKPEKLVLNGKIDELPELSNGYKTFILILRNITESRRKEREKSEVFFLAATSMHNELSAIIRKIKNNNLELPESNILKAIDFCYLLLNKLIYYAEMDSGPLRLFKKPVNATEFVTKIVEERRIEFKDNKVTLNTQIIDSEQKVFMDSEKIKLSINLLLDFIFSKTNKCNEIFIEGHVEAERFVLRFIQLGYFYNTIELYEITKPGLQVERFMQSDLGMEELNVELSYIKHVLTSHGGEFSISNEHDGTRFSLIIPF